MRLGDVSVICRVMYLQFPIQACFSSTSDSQLPASSPSTVLFLGLPDIGHRTSPKIWGGFLDGAYIPGVE